MVSFDIPSDWIDELSPEGSGVYFAERPDSGTLRLNVLTMDGPNPLPPQAARQYLQEFCNVPFERINDLPGDSAVGLASERGVEDGEPIGMSWWYVVSPLPPENLRLAVFSYTWLAAREHDAEQQDERRMVDALIRRARFTPHLVAGE
jgi:hypothetical protein